VTLVKVIVEYCSFPPILAAPLPRRFNSDCQEYWDLNPSCGACAYGQELGVSAGGAPACGVGRVCQGFNSY